VSAKRQEAVIDQARSPDQDEFEAWVSPHLPVLSALATRQVGTADAPDVVQEALLRAWRRRETYQPDHGSPRAWLIAVLYDQARRHRIRHLWPHHRPEPDNPEPTAGPDHADDRLDIERAVAALPRRQRQVITLHYLADLPVADVAIALGITDGSVKTHLHNARAALRSALEHS